MFILLTGATGFVGGHVTSQLLEASHKVRAIVRPGRSDRLRATFPNTGDKLEAFELASLESSDYTDALKDIDAVIHVASPAFLKGETNKEIFEGSYKGTIHIVESAIKNGIKRIVVTGSLVSMMDADMHQAFGTEALGPHSFSNLDKSFDYENAASTRSVYHAAKAIADKEIWKIQEAHPEVDITVLIVPSVLGPFVDNYPAHTSRVSIGTDDSIYALVKDTPESGDFAPTTPPFSPMADVRDIAKAHVLSLTSPPSKERKRLLLHSKSWIWKDVVELIREERPEIAHRLPRKDAIAPPQITAPFDTTLTQQIIGLKEYIPWQETILASLDEGLKLENGSQT